MTGGLAHAAGKPSMKQASIRILYGYWNEVRRGRRAPTRFEIEPSRIASILSETFILEAGDEGAFPFRLAGTRICEHFGRELRGRDFARLAGADRLSVARTLTRSRSEACGLLMEIEAAAPDGRPAHFEAIVLPLLHPASDVTRYLGAISAIDPPAWLGTEILVPSGLASRELLWPDGEPAARPEARDRQIPFSPMLAGARIVRSERRQFRILDGGRKE